MNDFDVDLETAEHGFNQWGEAMDLDFDVTKMDTDDLNGFNRLKDRVVTAIQKGSATFSDDGEIIYHPQKERSKYKDPIVFRERTGASMMAMDRSKKGEDAKKTYMVMADMTGLHPNQITTLVGIDIKVCEAIFQLLMD